MQYIYVNNRILFYHQLINNAILQAYQEKFTSTQHLNFVLFLEINPNQIDINIHPNKNQILFYPRRLIHDFIYQAVVIALQNKNLPLREKIKNINTRPAAGENYFSNPDNKNHNLSNKSTIIPQASQKEQRSILEQQLHLRNCITLVEENKSGNVCNTKIKVPTTIAKPDIISSTNYSFGRILTLIAPCYLLIESNKNNLALLSLSVTNKCLIEYKLKTGIIDDTLRSQPLFLPLSINLCNEEIKLLKYYQLVLKKIGILLEIDHNKAILKAIPLLLKKHFQKMFPKLLVYLRKKKVTVKHQQIIIWIVKNLPNESVVWSYYQAIQLLADIELLWPQWIKNTLYQIRFPLNFEPIIQAINKQINNE